MKKFEREVKIQIGLDRVIGFAMIKMVNPTVLSVRRDGSFF